MNRADLFVTTPQGSFQASDLDAKAVEATRLCAESAGVIAALTIEQKHFEQAMPAAEHGFVVTNPPYGERLALQRAGALFRRIGDWLVQRCGGWRAAAQSNAPACVSWAGGGSGRRRC